MVRVTIKKSEAKKATKRATKGCTVTEIKGLYDTDTTIFVSFGYDVSVTLKIPFNCTDQAKTDLIEEAKKGYR